MAFKSVMGIALCVQLVACAGPQVGRIGPAVALPNGPPRSDCERNDWYELAPTRVQATGATAGVLFNTHYSQLVDGLGVFRHQESDPEDLEDLWSRMDEPVLQRKHQARIEPVDAAHERTLALSLGGLALGLTGVGIAAAVGDQDRTLATITGVTGLAALVVGTIGALAAQPSGEEQLYADARRKLFIAGEDDRVAVERGVNRANSRRRRQCGGTPSRLSVPQPVRAPAPAPSAPAPDDASLPVSDPTGNATEEPPAAPGAEQQATPKP